MSVLLLLQVRNALACVSQAPVYQPLPTPVTAFGQAPGVHTPGALPIQVPVPNLTAFMPTSTGLCLPTIPLYLHSAPSGVVPYRMPAQNPNQATVNPTPIVKPVANVNPVRKVGMKRKLKEDIQESEKPTALKQMRTEEDERKIETVQLNGSSPSLPLKTQVSPRTTSHIGSICANPNESHLSPSQERRESITGTEAIPNNVSPKEKSLENEVASMLKSAIESRKSRNGKLSDGTDIKKKQTNFHSELFGGKPLSIDTMEFSLNFAKTFGKKGIVPCDKAGDSDLKVHEVKGQGKVTNGSNLDRNIWSCIHMGSSNDVDDQSEKNGVSRKIVLPEKSSADSTTTLSDEIKSGTEKSIEDCQATTTTTKIASKNISPVLEKLSPLMKKVSQMNKEQNTSKTKKNGKKQDKSIKSKEGVIKRAKKIKKKVSEIKKVDSPINDIVRTEKPKRPAQKLRMRRRRRLARKPSAGENQVTSTSNDVTPEHNITRGKQETTPSGGASETTQAKKRRKRRSILDELANSEGYVAEERRPNRRTDSLFADPSKLTREEKALQVSRTILYVY